MKLHSINEKIAIDIDAVLLGLLILTSTDTVLFGTNSVQAFSWVSRIYGFVFSVWCVLTCRNFFSKKLLLLFTLVAIVSLSAVVNGSNMMTVLSRILAIIVAFCIALKYDLKRFILIFNKVLCLIAIIAIVVGVLTLFLPQSFFGILPTETNVADRKFYVFFFGAIQYIDFTRTFVRIQGVFWEPGAFSIYLIIALVFEMFFINEKSKLRVMAFIVAVFMTFSTTGYICLFGIMLLFLFVKRSSYFKLWLKILFSCLLIYGIGFFIFGKDTALFERVFGKLVNMENTAVVRFSSFTDGFRVALDNPWFGVGPSGVKENMSVYGSGGMLTNEFVYQFVAYGFIFGILFIVFTLSFFIKNRNEYLFVRLGLFAVLMLAYCGEVFYSFLPFVFVAYGVGNGKKE